MTYKLSIPALAFALLAATALMTPSTANAWFLDCEGKYENGEWSGKCEGGF